MGDKDGGAAFPSASMARSNDVADPAWRIESAGGMSLRDYFAGQAPDPLVWWLDLERGKDAMRAKTDDRFVHRNYLELAASWAGAWADAKIAERDK